MTTLPSRLNRKNCGTPGSPAAPRRGCFTRALPGAAHEDARLIALHSLRGEPGVRAWQLTWEWAWPRYGRLPPSCLICRWWQPGGVNVEWHLKRTWADIAKYSPAELDLDMLESIVGKHESGWRSLPLPPIPPKPKRSAAIYWMHLCNCSENILIIWWRICRMI